MATEKTQKMILDAMKKKFAEDPTSNTTTYKREGYTQSKDKREFQEWGAKIAKDRGIPAYNVNVHLGGMTLGQRQLMPYNVSGTDVMCEGDDLHYVNNPAMQQMWDEIRRTVVVGLDQAHETLTRRLGKEVTPETINGYLEALNHTMPGAAIVQEHMVETHPALVEDCFVKVFTGDDDLAAEIDKAFLVDINKLFPAKQAEQLKKAIGKTLWQGVHIPTIVSRTCDGGNTSRWSAMQIGMSFIAAYNMCAGEAAVADLAFAAKHASLIEMANMLPARRARGSNEPGGVGFTQYATAAYTDNILDDYAYYGNDYAKKYGADGSAPATMDVVNDLGTEVTLYGIEQYEKYPTTLEDHFGGSQRATVISIAAGGATALATGHSQAGLSAWYLSMYLHKEAHGRLGFYGYDLQDQCGATNVFSIASDEGCIGECRGANYPNYAMNVGHQGGYTSVVAAAHAGKDAFCVNPLVKTCFADELINFDFRNPRAEFGKAAL